MKKLPALLLTLALATALLASCEMFVPEPTERVLPSFSLPAGTENPADTDTSGAPAPDESADPAEENYGFTVFPEGNYLADPKFDTDEFLPDYDADLSFVQYFSTGDFGPGGTYRSPVLCATDDTVYFFDGGSDLIMFWDKATGISSPLCGRPECLHSGSSCNAYVQAPNGLRVYEGKLYWVGGRMDLDGTNRESGPWTINTEGMHSNLTTVIHRGYVYTAGSNQNVVTGGVAASSVTVNAAAMDGGESFTLLSRVVDGLGGYCTVSPVGNDLYIMVYYFNYLDSENPEDGAYNTVELYRWDSETRRAELLYKCAESETGLKLEREYFQPVPGDGIYLMGCRFPEAQWSGLYHSYICRYSFDTGELEELAEFDCEEGRYYHMMNYTSSYILVEYNEIAEDGQYTYSLFLYDYAGNLVLTQDLGEHYFSYLMGADGDFIYGARLYARLSYHDYFAVPLDGGEIVAIE